jgi:hypothetical protein
MSLYLSVAFSVKKSLSVALESDRSEPVGSVEADEILAARKRLFFERAMREFGAWLVAELFPDDEARPAIGCYTLDG